MKIIVNESQFRVLTEQQGIEDFTARIAEEYADSVYMLAFITHFIRTSGCQKISIASLKYGAAGVSLVDGIVISDQAFNYSFSGFLYILFHETAHQYQYKKYGVDAMYNCYTGELPVEEGAKWMKQVENVADEFATRKIREMQQKFGEEYQLKEPEKLIYKDTPVEQFVQLINLFKEEIKKQGYQNKEEISEILFNYVKNG